MTTQPAQPARIRSLDQLAVDYLQLAEQIEELNGRLGVVKHSIQAAMRDEHGPDGVGTHVTAAGVNVTVGAPPRRFNLDRAWAMLTAEQQALAVAPDAAKVKRQLSGVLVEECMDPGTGSPRVTVK